MKIAVTISRILLGVIFAVSGLNGFLHFIPQPPLPPGLLADFNRVMTESHYLGPVFAVQLIAGILFLVNRYVILALLIIAPVIVNILIFHLLLLPAGIAPGALAAILWLVVAFHYRPFFASIFQP